MKNNKVIILGASGLVGRYLFEEFKSRGIPVIGTYNKNEKSGLVQFDILDSSIDDLQLEGVEYVIICSAMVGVDNCRIYLDKSREINVEGLKRLIKKFFKRGIVPVFISSVFVFNGRGNYKEDDFRNPANEYGRQKKEVEDFIIENVDEYLILRLGRVFGVNSGEGILTDAFERYKKGEEILCNDYEELSLTYGEDIARGIKELMERGKRGVFHLESKGHKNRFEWINDFFNYLGVDDAKIKKCSIDDFNFLEPRAKNQFSDSSKFIEEIGFEFTPIEECYKRIMENLR